MDPVGTFFQISWGSRIIAGGRNCEAYHDTMIDYFETFLPARFPFNSFVCNVLEIADF